MTNLTKKQSRVLKYIVGFQAKYEHSPSLEDIRKHFGWVSVSTSHKYLKQLERRGAISRIPGAHRAITVLKGEVS